MIDIDTKKLLFRLAEADGASSREERVAQLVKETVAPFCDEIQSDSLFSLRAIKHADAKGAPTLLIDAHMDEIGFMVSAITEEGFLRFVEISGIDRRVLLAAEVTVHGREELFGVICCKPPHLSSAEERKKTVPTDELVIDVGYKHPRVRELVSVGDTVTLRQKSVRLMDGQVSGKAFDDRAGVVAGIKVMEFFKGKKLPFNLVLLASTQEEAGLRGARTGAYLTMPDEAIVIDVAHGYTPDAKKEETGRVGKGPMIGYAAPLSRGIFSALKKIAGEKKIPFQLEIMSDRSGTNADMIELTGSGVKVGLLSIPLKYMHTGIETVSIKDIDATAELVCAYIEKRAGELL